MICEKCNKDHSRKQKGSLSECELEAYCTGGARSTRGKQDRFVFSSGRRFQFKGAR